MRKNLGKLSTSFFNYTYLGDIQFLKICYIFKHDTAVIIDINFTRTLILKHLLTTLVEYCMGDDFYFHASMGYGNSKGNNGNRITYRYIVFQYVMYCSY